MSLQKSALTLCLISYALFNAQAHANCPDFIEEAGKDTSVKYKTENYYPGSFEKAWTDAGCKKSKDSRKWKLPHSAGKSCAKPRIDGCSWGQAGIFVTFRDKLLATPACNQHDLCYSTSGTNKTHCDAEFTANLNEINKKFHGTLAAPILGGSVFFFGNESHDKGQTWGKDHNCSN